MIKLSSPVVPETAFEKIKEVIQSGYWVQGKYVSEFEDLAKKYIGTKEAVVVSSGTAALHLALIALGIGRGDEVIVPAFTFPATINVVEVVGAKPVVVDINLEDYCIDVELIERAITEKTKAIIPVHEFGHAADIMRLKEIAQKYNLFILEDAACAFGTELDGKKIGSFGNVGCFSLHPRKAISTGEGGIIVTDNESLSEKIKALRNHGIINKNNKNDFYYAGLNYRLTEFQAVLGIEQIKIIDEIIDYRIQLSRKYDEEFKSIPWMKLPAVYSDRRMVYQTYHVLLADHINRNEVIEYLKRNEIETNYGAQAINALKYYKGKYQLQEADFPNAFAAFNQGLALPFGAHIKPEDIQFIKNALFKYGT